MMDVIVHHGNGCRACHEEMEYLISCIGADFSGTRDILLD
jgi:hypothetical protein